MNMKISLVCLSICIAVATSMSIKDLTDKINPNNERFEKNAVSYKKDMKSTTDKDPADYKMQSESGLGKSNVGIEYPSAYDWRIQGDLSPVPNIIGCNRSDWAFATVGMLEGYLYKMNHYPMRLSVQELIHCARNLNLGYLGCDSGDVQAAITYIQKRGLPTYNSYPFNASETTCNNTRPRDGIRNNLSIKAYTLDPADENVMQYYISSTNPITATIRCWEKFLQYERGIFSENCKTDNHGATDYNVLIVGYGEINSQKYWIVKNWMGENWGENGYAKVVRNGSTIFSEVVTIIINI